MKTFTAMRLPLGADDEWAVVGRDRWVLWHHPEARSVAYARFRRSSTRQWAIEEVRFVPAEQSESVRANDLRLLALGRLEALAADPVVDLMLRSNSQTALPRLDPSVVPATDALTACRKLPERQRKSMLAITVPPKGQRDIFFYVLLDAIYARAASQSRHPAQDIADANNVPVTTVHAWMKALKKFKASYLADIEDSNDREFLWVHTVRRGLEDQGFVPIDTQSGVQIDEPH